MVVFLWWCLCGGVLVVVFVWWCFCGGDFVVVFLWWCSCGGVFRGGVLVVVFESNQHIVRVIRTKVQSMRTKVQSIKVVTNHSIGTCSVDLYIYFTFLKLPAPPRAVLLVFILVLFNRNQCLKQREP